MRKLVVHRERDPVFSVINQSSHHQAHMLLRQQDSQTRQSVPDPQDGDTGDPQGAEIDTTDTQDLQDGDTGDTQGVESGTTDTQDPQSAEGDSPDSSDSQGVEGASEDLAGIQDGERVQDLSTENTTLGILDANTPVVSTSNNTVPDGEARNHTDGLVPNYIDFLLHNDDYKEYLLTPQNLSVLEDLLFAAQEGFREPSMPQKMTTCVACFLVPFLLSAAPDSI